MNKQPPRSVTRRWGVYLVGVTTAFIMGLLIWQTTILAGKEWCAQALSAEKLTGVDGSKIDAMTACISLLTRQVDYIGIAHIIGISVIALSLGVLVVIVIAAARLELEATRAGVKTKLESDEGNSDAG